MMHNDIQESNLYVLNGELQNVAFCIEIKFIKKVFLLPLIEPLPNSPQHILGVCNLAGTAVPILDTTACIGIPRNQSILINSPIVLCEHQNQMLGFLVKKIIGIEKFNIQRLQLQDKLTSYNEHISATIELHTKINYIIDIPSLFNAFSHINLQKKSVNEDENYE